MCVHVLFVMSGGRSDDQEFEPNDLARLTTEVRKVSLYSHPRPLYQPDVGKDVHWMSSDDRPCPRYYKAFWSQSLDPEAITPFSDNNYKLTRIYRRCRIIEKMRILDQRQTPL